MPIYKGKQRSYQFLAKICDIRMHTLYRRVGEYKGKGLSEEAAVVKAMAFKMTDAALAELTGLTRTGFRNRLKTMSLFEAMTAKDLCKRPSKHKIGDLIGKTRVVVMAFYAKGFALTGCKVCWTVHKTKYSDLNTRVFEKCICESIRLRSLGKREHKNSVVIEKGSIEWYNRNSWLNKRSSG